MLPPGQKARADFPRFGLPPYAKRFPSNTVDRTVVASVDGKQQVELDIGSTELPRSEVQANFHCVTTWSHIGARWGGVCFVDFYEKQIEPLCSKGGLVMSRSRLSRIGKVADKSKSMQVAEFT